jgi:hypothetical protein
MGSLHFDLTIFGGKADESRVEAVRIASIIDGLAHDLVDVCRNISEDDHATPWEHKEESCRLYVVGLPQKGQSVTWPFATEDSASPWGEESGRLYISGLNELREAIPRRHDPSLPVGFSRQILERVSGYYDILNDYSGMALDVQANGRPAQRVVFDRKLRAIVNLKLAWIERDAALPMMRSEPDKRLYGHSVQGVLYELSDPDYDEPDAVIRFEVDPHDGTRWVCRLKRKDAPENLQQLWRSTVVVEGTATMRPKKPEMEVERIIPLQKLGVLQSFDRLMQLSEGLTGGRSLEQVMDEIRERR